MGIEPTPPRQHVVTGVPHKRTLQLDTSLFAISTETLMVLEPTLQIKLLVDHYHVAPPCNV